MKRFLTTFCASLALCVPAMAHSEIEDYSYGAMQCMKLGECTEGVYKLETGNHTGEVKDILFNLDQMGVEVYEAIPEYFVEEYRALYYSDKNVIFLNMGYVDTDDMFIKTLRHEAWHAAQDCMAGGMHNSDILSILDHEIIPSYIIDETFLRYGYDPTVVRIEREAVWAMKVKGMTVKALEACNSDTPMWEIYFPPKRTWKYLYWNGYLNEGI